MANLKIAVMAMVLLAACSTQTHKLAVTMNSETCQKIMFDTADPLYREKPYYSICIQEYGFTDTPHEYKSTFKFQGETIELLVAKPLAPVKVNSPIVDGRMTVFSETEIEGGNFWIGYLLSDEQSHIEAGLFYQDDTKRKKLVSSSRGFFKSFQGLNFAFVVDDSDQHREFTTVYLIGTQPSDSPWAQRIYVLAGTIVDAVVLGDALLVSGTEMGRPFAANVDIDAHPPIFDRLRSN